MLREHSRQFHTSIQLVDALLAAACFVVALWLMPSESADAFGTTATHGPYDGRVLALGIVGAVSWPLTLQWLGLYTSQRAAQLGQIVGSLVLAACATIAVSYSLAFLSSTPVQPAFPLICGGLQCAVITTLRVLIHGTLRWFRSSGLNLRHVLIVGSGPRAAHVQSVIESNPSWGISILGFLDHNDPPAGPAVQNHPRYDLAAMPTILNDKVVDEVIVACPRSMLAEIVPVVDACAMAGVPITLLSDVFGDFLPAPRVTRFGALPALSFAPVHHNPVKISIKRAFDIAGAALLLVMIAPILLAAGIAIRLSSRGPIFFRQVRCGMNGRQFVMHKLRTMYVDAEERKRELAAQNEMDGPVFKMKNDPRITPIGRFLRRFSIDELPQIWDVLWGRMSLVGPRPSLPSEVVSYETFQRRRLSMRPGLTCLWQVSGRNKIGFDDWVRLDLEYIDTWSLRNDLKILVRTIPAVVSGSGS